MDEVLLHLLPSAVVAQVVRRTRAVDGFDAQRVHLGGGALVDVADVAPHGVEKQIDLAFRQLVVLTMFHETGRDACVPRAHGGGRQHPGDEVSRCHHQCHEADSGHEQPPDVP